MSIRPILERKKSNQVIEGAGVRLDRAFGFGNTNDFDPFLLLDDSRNNDPKDYQLEFPWHPHRGIETITYILKGSVAWHGPIVMNTREEIQLAMTELNNRTFIKQ